MAIKKEYGFRGIACNYWKIISRNDDTIKNKTVVRLGVYASADTRRQSLENVVDQKEFTFDGVNKSYQQIYDLIKLTPYFEGSTDC